MPIFIIWNNPCQKAHNATYSGVKTLENLNELHIPADIRHACDVQTLVVLADAR